MKQPWEPRHNSEHSLAWNVDINVHLWWTPGIRNGFVQVYFDEFSVVPMRTTHLPRNWVMVHNRSGMR